MVYGKALGVATCTYNSALSKNQRFTIGRSRVYKNAKATAAENTLFHELRLLKKTKWYQNKIYMDVVVFKPRVDVDAVNFVDAIADVLKRVILVDDRYFSIKSWDWHLDRIDPRIIVKVYQPARRNAK